MNKLDQLELNTAHSFQLAKADIIALQTELAAVKRSYLELAKKLMEVHAASVAKTRKQKVVARKAPVSRKKKYVASKAAAKVHSKACYFAKNIKPKNKRVFGSKNAALNAGYRFCDCLN